MAISDAELLERLPDTWINHDNKEFYRGWLERRLLVNRCDDCGHWHHPPKPVCPSCWSSNVTATEVSGRGTVHLLIQLHQGPPAPGVDYATPLPVATVELEEQAGLRYTSGLINASPDQLAIGTAVQLTWTSRYDAPYPVFEPCASADPHGA
jgi:uncharacterized protein